MKALKTIMASVAIALMSLTAFAAGPYPETDASKDIESAVGELKDGQLLMVSFGANWCYNCRNLSKGLHSAALESWVEDNFEVVKVNVGRAGQNAETVKSYGNPTQFGIPAVVFADKNGNPILKLSSNQLIPAIRGGSAKLKAVLESAHAEALAQL